MAESHPERVIHEGNRLNLHAVEIAGDDGTKHVHEIVRHRGAVVLLPLIDRDTVVLIENYRPSVRETLLELPAGTREPDEAPEQTAARELAEETGYSAGQLTPLHEFFSSPGISDERMHLFVARELTAGEANREATERIENRVATREEIRQWIERGHIRDAKTLIGLYAFLYSPEIN